MALVTLDTDIMILVDRNATVAHVQLEMAGFPVAEATGSAKRDKGDVHNENIAIDLAVGRALKNLVRQMVSRGTEAVKQATK